MSLKAPSHLKTLADYQSGAANKPTKLDALLMKEAHRAERRAKDLAFRLAVIARDCKDGRKDRITGAHMAVVMEAVPHQLQVHHLAGRADTKVRHDPRNGIAVRRDTHEKLTAHLLKIVGAENVFFVEGSATAYWDADHKLEVLDTETGVSRWI